MTEAKLTKHGRVNTHAKFVLDKLRFEVLTFGYFSYPL